MTQALGSFLTGLDGFSERIPLSELVGRIEDLTIDWDDVREFVVFARERYRRNLIHSGAAYHALILCWRSGQRSPIHDHRGSSCAVRVLEGLATESQFERTENGLIYPTFSRELPAGSVSASQDDDIHQMSNLQPVGRDLVTLHIYSPPLLVMGTYSLIEPSVREFVDPIYEFAQGAGI